MDKRDLLKLILSGEVEREKLPLLVKASKVAGRTLFAVKDYKHDEETLSDDLVTTHDGKFDGNEQAEKFTFAELEQFQNELGIKIVVIIFKSSPPYEQLLRELEK